MTKSKPKQKPAKSRRAVDQLNLALKYGERGLRVIPIFPILSGHCGCTKGAACSSPGKHPMTKNGARDGSTDPKVIRNWFKNTPAPNIGICTGSSSQIIVFDVDPRNGGEKTLKKQEAALGALPETVEAATGGKGRHLFFRYPRIEVKRDVAGKLIGPGVDVLGEGSFVVAAKSKHVSGGTYSWPNGKGFPSRKPAKLPANWLAALASGTYKAAEPLPSPSAGQKGRPIIEGQRNIELTKLAGKLHRAQMSEEAMLGALRAENLSRCTPPLTDTEIKAIVTSVMRYPAAQTAGGDIAEGLMGQVLHQHFARGDHLVFAVDGQFWHYEGTHWVPAPKPWIEKLVLQTITVTGPHGGQTSTGLMRQVTALMSAHCAV